MIRISVARLYARIVWPPKNERKRSARRRPKVDKLGDLQREIDAYNREHGTALTYGQYVLKFGR